MNNKASLSRIVALVLIALAVNTSAIEFLTPFAKCTNANDGIESNGLFFAAPACQPILGGTSLGGSCSSGVYKHFNSTDCTGTVLTTFNNDECVTSSGSTQKTRFKCQDINDPEYIRMRLFLNPVAAGVDCNSTSPMTNFIRMNKCFESSTVNGQSSKLEKVNSTAFSTTTYSAPGCNSADVLQTTTDLANGECVFGTRVDFVLAADVGNSAGLAHISGYVLTFVMAFAGMVAMA